MTWRAISSRPCKEDEEEEGAEGDKGAVATEGGKVG